MTRHTVATRSAGSFAKDLARGIACLYQRDKVTSKLLELAGEFREMQQAIATDCMEESPTIPDSHTSRYEASLRTLYEVADRLETIANDPAEFERVIGHD